MMNVDLPDTGCNIIASSTSFYNYSPDSHTRSLYVIYEGKAYLQQSVYNQYGYTYTGTCLTDSDFVYKPELEVYFPILSSCLFCFICILLYKIMLKRLLP